MSTIAATITALSAIVTALTGAVIKMRTALAPILRRRTFPICIVVSEEHDAEARSFVASLRAAGYRDVDLTRDSSTCLGRRAIVLWRPSPETAASELNRAQSSALEATVLIYTQVRLEGIPLGEGVLMANSQLRLRGDLGTLAEIRRP